MSKDINFSVIIPTYNRKKKLIKSIYSALNQTYKPYEIIVCDDGSKINTKEIVDSFKNKKLKYVYLNRSGGPAKPRNVGISLSKGNWIAFLDSDDVWYPSKLKIQRDLIISHPNYSIFCSNACDLKNNFYHKTAYLGFNTIDLIKSNLVITSSLIIYKKTINKNKFQVNANLVGYEDYDLWLKLSLSNNFFYYNKSLLAYDNKSNSRLSFTKKNNDLIATFIIYKNLIIESIKLNKVNLNFFLFIIIILFKKTKSIII